MAVAFFGTNWIAHHSLKPAYMHRSGDDNWYDYTYRARRPDRSRAIGRIRRDWIAASRRGKSTPATCLVGHHGIFSLTPVWLLSFLGMGLWMFRRGDPRLRWWAAATVGISLACLAFYLGQPQIEPQLRRQHQRPALDVLARAALAVDDAAGGRRLCLAALDPRLGADFAGLVGSFGQLPDVESLDASLADELLAVSRIGSVTCSFHGHRCKE